MSVLSVPGLRTVSSTFFTNMKLVHIMFIGVMTEQVCKIQGIQQKIPLLLILKAAELRIGIRMIINKILLPVSAAIVAAAYWQDQQNRQKHKKKMINAIKRRDDLLQTVNRMADMLLRYDADDFDSTVYQCMGMLARAIHADRMYLYKSCNENEDDCFTKLYEWPENTRLLSNNDSDSGMEYVENTSKPNKTLMSGNSIHCLVCNMPKDDQERYDSRHILAVLLIPVFVHNKFWGYVGFDNCHSKQLFAKNEESIVLSGSLIIANAILRYEYVNTLQDSAVKLESALEEARKANNEKSDFIAKISHEMRTPLNAVIGLSELTLNNAGIDEEAATNLDKINSSGTLLLRIVNDILEISKMKSGKAVISPDRYDVSGMISDAVLQNVLRIGSKPIRFELNIDENMPAYLFGDELRIRQIINNLLSNAIKYTEKGMVKLELSYKNDEDNAWMTITVSDTGIGIQPENLERLFTDYLQFGPASQHQTDGTGLGLAVTKNLVELMEGTIRADSKYGEGSTFTVKLPQGVVTDKVIGPDAALNLKNLKYSADRRKQKERLERIRIPYANVLIVDDNSINLKVVKDHMKPYGMRIDCVTSGQAAIAAMREEKIRYQAIFMDHMMPEMDGVEAVRIIREEIGTDYAKTIPIIALTANAVAGSEEMFLQKGFQAFISKPINLTKLDYIINHWIRDKMLLINGIDVQKGIHYSGSEALFISLLGDFYNLIDLKAAKIENGLAEGSIRDITIEFHALKNTAKTIGAEKLSEMFTRLEQYGNTNNIKALESELPEVMKEYRSFKPVLRPFGEVEEEEKETASETRLISLLNKLRSAMGNFDLDSADQTIKQLGRLHIPEPCQQQMEALKAYVADVDTEETIRTTGEMITKLIELTIEEKRGHE